MEVNAAQEEDYNNVECTHAASSPITDKRKSSLNWKAKPVLADEYYRKMETVSVFAAEVEDKKIISSLVKLLTEKYPLGRLQHLKRVGQVKLKESKKMLILLKEHENEETMNSLLDLLPEEEQHRGLGSKVYKCEVPKYGPLTRAQYEECIVLWPTQFHENKHIAKVISGSIFNEDDCYKMQDFMRQAISAAHLAPALSGAVVVDPKSEKIVTLAVDQRHDHPLHHAVMVAINQVARGQREKDPDYPPNGSSKDLESNSKVVAALPYLCTGYDLYVTREPCTMCAMALVHSRIGRVFYGATTKEGALGSLLKIHTHRMLNHRYPVWKDICLSECEKIS